MVRLPIEVDKNISLSTPIGYSIGDGWVGFYAEPLVTLANGQQTLSLYGKALAAYTAAMASVVAVTGTKAATVMAVRKQCLANGASAELFIECMVLMA